MVKLLIEVDDEVLAEAQRVLGTATETDTVNAALIEVAKRIKRAEALVELVEMGEQGDFDILLRKGNYRL
ncbi:type II toxin-antitoxin system VapB family antitoxin [Nocardia sp. NPDC051030]|uniref:type II toxin-antitoxin system VapB family antitoxin n=1 Tax=Nocardia sp. NPDC051030 TaxID=3155162 RepID=UPI0034385317